MKYIVIELTMSALTLVMFGVLVYSVILEAMR